MTLFENTFQGPSRFVNIWSLIVARLTKRSSASTVEHLDDRMRADVGLPPLGDNSETRSEVAARIAMMAMR